MPGRETWHPASFSVRCYFLRPPPAGAAGLEGPGDGAEIRGALGAEIRGAAGAALGADGVKIRGALGGGLFATGGAGAGLLRSSTLGVEGFEIEGCDPALNSTLGGAGFVMDAGPGLVLDAGAALNSALAGPVLPVGGGCDPALNSVFGRPESVRRGSSLPAPTDGIAGMPSISVFKLSRPGGSLRGFALSLSGLTFAFGFTLTLGLTGLVLTLRPGGFGAGPSFRGTP